MIISTGFEELDKMLDGGLRTNFCYSIKGTAGAGKTVLSLFLAWGALKQNIPVLFISTEVIPSKIELYFKSFGIDITPYKEKNLLQIEKMSLKPEGIDVIQTDHFDLSAIVTRVKKKISDIDAKVVIFDSLSAFIADFKYKDVARSSYMDFIRQVTGLDTSLILSIEVESQDTNLNQIDFLVDGVISIKTEIRNNQLVKYVSIPKLRGAQPASNENRFIINKDGLRIFRAEHPPLGVVENAETGMIKLDGLLGGGVPIGSVVLVEINGEINYFPLFLTLLYNYLISNYGTIIHSNVQMNAPRILGEFERVGCDITGYLNAGDIIFLDKYNRSVTSTEAQEIGRMMTIDDMLSITVEMMEAFGRDTSVVLFGDLTDDANILSERDFLRSFALQAYNIKERKAISYSFINYNAIENKLLARLRTTADIIIRFTREGYTNHIECLKSSTGATFLAKIVEFKNSYPMIDIID